MATFKHKAQDLQQEKKVVFTAQSCKNFHLRWLICKYVFDQGCVPVNPFTTFDYFMHDLVDRDQIRNANNNLLKRCDELWVFGDISDGVLVEIGIYKQMNKTVRYFDISGVSEHAKGIKEIRESEAVMEENVKQHKAEILEVSL